MKLTDYVVDFLAKQGIKYIFGLTGGAVVHLFDSVDHNPKTNPIFNHHEQASALAAEAYSKITNNLGACFVTTGPGGTNAVTGVAAAWLDSIPCIYISGQTRYEHTTNDKPIRQLGSQQLDIIPLVGSITKYAVMVDNPKKIKYYLQKAAYIAKTGRPGPVWIDIPLNFQWIQIEPDELEGFDPSELKEKQLSEEEIDELVKRSIDMLSVAKRPVILAGYGIRLAHAEAVFKKVIETLNIPFVSTWTASDLLPTNNRSYLGRSGIAGQRGANLAVQNCDLLLSIGSHLSIPLTGTDYKSYARAAKKIVVDIDEVELGFETVKIDLPIWCDARKYLQKLLEHTETIKRNDISEWQKKCSKYKSYNKIPEAWQKQKKYVNPYIFVDVLSDELDSDDVIVIDGGGTVVYISFQAFKVKQGQRLIESSGVGAMGTGLPESIGACFANHKKRTICLCGDGSMQLNIQELETIKHHKLPIKVFIFNNEGYLAIRHTQDGFLDKNYIGSDLKGGMSLPDFQKVSKAYGIKAIRINNHKELFPKIKKALKGPGPVVCEIMISREQQLEPRTGFRKNPDETFSPRPLEDMYPYLDRKEFFENMIVEPLDVSKE